jgi:hypothetical protein
VVPSALRIATSSMCSLSNARSNKSNDDASAEPGGQHRTDLAKWRECVDS